MKKIYFLFFILLLSVSVFGENSVKLANNYISIEFTREDNNNIYISQIRDVTTNTDFIKSAENIYSLWSFKVKKNNDISGEATELTPKDCEKTIIRNTKTEIKLDFINVKKPDMETGFDVSCSVRLKNNDSYWNINISKNSEYGIWTVTYPYISDINTQDGDCLATPFRGGSFIKEFSNKEGIGHPYNETDTKRYKDIGYFLPNMMQWTSLTKNNSTLYLSPEDKKESIKTCNYLFHKPNSMNMVYVYYPENMSVAEKEYIHPAPFNISVIQGDWFDACKKYRKWGIENKVGAFAMGRLENRKDLPKWWIKNAIACQWNVNEKQCVDSLIYAKKYLEIPILLHAYLWNNFFFDEHYPNFLPCRPGFKEDMAKLKNMGYYIMPYTNGHLTDIKNSEYYKKYGNKLLVKNEKGEMPGEHCGKDADNRIACPGSEYADILKGEICNIMKEINFDALYIDQVGSSAPSPCFDREHSHPMGGGVQYAENYTEMINDLKAKLKEIKGDYVPITTEDCADVYPFEGWLRCNEGMGKNADSPLNIAVYSGYTLSFGDTYSDKDFQLGEICAINKTAVNFTKGIEPGWGIGNRNQLEKYPTFAKHFKNMALGRYKAYEYFNLGEMMRPVKINNIPVYKIPWVYKGDVSEREYPTVRTCSFYYKEKACVSFINITENKIRVNWEAKAKDLNLKNKEKYKIREFYPNESVIPANNSNNNIIKSYFDIDPLETKIFIIE